MCHGYGVGTVGFEIGGRCRCRVGSLLVRPHRVQRESRGSVGVRNSGEPQPTCWSGSVGHSALTIIGLVKRRVLIVCTGNIARSQMAEGLWRHYGGSSWEVFSAGTRPRLESHVHPLAVRVMAERGIDISGQRPKAVDAFAGETFDLVVTVCSQADQDCPAFPNAVRQERWPLDDPAIAGSDPERLFAIFRRIRDEAAERISAFLKCAKVAER
jgi:arsenate reductase